MQMLWIDLEYYGMAHNEISFCCKGYLLVICYLTNVKIQKFKGNIFLRKNNFLKNIIIKFSKRIFQN